MTALFNGRDGRQRLSLHKETHDVLVRQQHHQPHQQNEARRVNRALQLPLDRLAANRLRQSKIIFLNQDTIFFDGGEKLALRCTLPVYFVKMSRLRRGRYEMSFELIYDGKEEVAEYEITQRYVRKLERMICECPELWMWSHRRWKHKRTHAGR